MARGSQQRTVSSQSDLVFLSLQNAWLVFFLISPCSKPWLVINCFKYSKFFERLVWFMAVLFKFRANFCLESNRFARVFVACCSIFKQSFDSVTLFDISMADSLAKNPDDTFWARGSMSSIKLHTWMKQETPHNMIASFLFWSLNHQFIGHLSGKQMQTLC